LTIIELFSGTSTFTEVAKSRGHHAVSIDKYEPANLQADVLELSGKGILETLGLYTVDVPWASPPCQSFSVASMGKMWERAGVPKHPTAELGLALMRKTVALIEELNPIAWFIENPRGMMRKTPPLDEMHKQTVTYCQYGADYMKPTDIWTNVTDWVPRPMCKNGDPCHVSAPRGSKTGIQGIKGAKARGALPVQLCEEVLDAAERWVNG